MLKIKRTIAGFLAAVLILNQLQFLAVDQALAASPGSPAPGEKVEELGIIALVVERGLLQDSTQYRAKYSRKNLSDHIKTFAEDIQKRLPHTRTLIVRVDPADSPVKISQVLERLYYEGDDPKTNSRLVGIILIGNVPIPIVYEKEGTAQVSVYPYVDFYQKRFVYNYSTDHFEAASQDPPMPEIWHGLIVPPKKGAAGRQMLAEYFDKNHQYSIGNPEYSQFDERVLVGNLTSEIAQFNPMDYRNYLRYARLLEETLYKRFNKHLLKKVIQEVSREMSPDTPADQVQPIMDDGSINALPDIQTETIIKKYTVPLPDALKTYLGKLNRLAEVSGRWDSALTDSPASIISMRDTYTAYLLRGLNDELEKKVNEAIDRMAIPQDVVNSVDLNIRVKNCQNVPPERQPCDTVSFSGTVNYLSYLSGQKVADIANVNQCGIMVGQARPQGTDVLDNNSVLVEANRMYNSKTMIIPSDDDDDPEDHWDYKLFAGCVANNMLKPWKCFPDNAFLSLFDIVGSREIEPPEDADSHSGLGLSRCDRALMTFKPRDDDAYTRDAALLPTAIVTRQTLQKVIDDAYLAAIRQNFIQPIDISQAILGFNLYAIVNKQASLLIETMMKKNRSFLYQAAPGIFIELSASPVTRPVAGTLKHNEPTEEHYRAIKAAMTTPSLPADGIHFIQFKTATGQRQFEHVNLFKIHGADLQEVTDRFLQMVQAKNEELNQALERNDDIIVKYFLDHPDVIEPILWQNLSLDQKHLYVLDKYLNQDTYFPVPAGSPPKRRPAGYQALYINAPGGDARGFRYQIHGSILGKENFKDGEMDEARAQARAAATATATPRTEDSGTTRQTRASPCGDMSGVEIWEWFDALQCWLTEEVLPANELFSLDNSCSQASPAPSQAEEEEEPADPMEDTSAVPSNLKVVMNRQTLTPGSEDAVSVQVLNNQNQIIPGFLEGEIQASVTPSSLGSFDKEKAKPALGEAQFKFKARLPDGQANQTGEGKLKFVYENFSQEISVRVVDRLSLRLSAARDANPGRVAYKVRVELVDASGSLVTNVQMSVQLSTLRYMDGAFGSDGVVELSNGVGEGVFYPSPARPAIDLVAQSPFSESGTYRLIQPPNPPHHIVIRPQKFLMIDRAYQLPVEVVDVNGVTAAGFNNTVQVKVTESTKKFGSVASGNISIRQGKGSIGIRTGTVTGPLNLIASFPNLKSGLLEIPVVAGMTSDEMNYLDGNDLFASFIGFPAGDFTQENYFGGAHLFNGKTEAVFGSMKEALPRALAVIYPNGYFDVKDPRYSIHPSVIDGELRLQISDDRELKEILNTETPFRFDTAKLYTENTTLEPGRAYLELMHSSVHAAEVRDGFTVADKEGNTIFTLLKNNLVLQDPEARLFYEKDAEKPILTLLVAIRSQPVARLYLNFASQLLDPSGLDVSAPLEVREVLLGKSTNDLRGLSLINPLDEPESVFKTDEDSGWKEDQKYMILFAAGNTIGDSVKYNMPTDAILLGDPTIRLETARHSSLPYDNTVGRKVYQDSKGAGIRAMTPIDFNNDGYQDVAAVLSDSRIRLLEGGPTEPPLRDRGDVAFLADKAIALMAFDFKKDGYPELLVATDEGRLAILNNERGVLTRTNKTINVGKKIYQILKADMDADRQDDLITLDSRGDIKIFYGRSGNIPEDGSLVANYGFSVNLTDNLSGDLKIRYAGMPEPEESQVRNPAPQSAVTGPVSASLNQTLQNFMSARQRDVDQNAAQSFVRSQAQVREQEARGTPPAVPKLPWAENGETQTFFTKLSQASFIHAEKTVRLSEGAIGQSRLQTNVDLNETLLYTIRLRSNRALSSLTIADTVSDALRVDEKSVKCERCRAPKIQASGTSLFIGNLNLPAGYEIAVTYEAKVIHTPKVNILLKKLDSPADPYTDIVVSPPYNNTGQLIEHYSTAPRRYAVRATPPPTPEENPIAGQTQSSDRCKAAMESLDPEDPDFDSALAACGLSNIKSQMDAGTFDASGQSVSDPDAEDCQGFEGCANAALDSAIDAINDFACMGSACFPMPLNMAFLVPGNLMAPFAMPLFAFPTTLPTPFGPLPFLWPGSFIGAAQVPGPITSLIRLYLAPTLTGGMGVAFCWGPYAGTMVPPPPLIPIPYPPPIGNCLVNALPMGGLPVCKEIERGITKAMDAANSVINDINSGIAAVNNNPYVGGNINTTDEQGAGGLEISLAIDLGNKRKFNAPSQSFTNHHIPSLDSIGSVLSSWWDRQLVEITSKLLILPNIQFILPDFQKMFAPDAEQFSKNLEALGNVITGNARETAKRSEEIWDKKENKNLDTTQRLFKQWEALDTSIGAYNANVFEQIFDLLNSIPFVNINQLPVEFKIPWLSPQQIRAFILDLQRWVDHMKRELDRLDAIWDKYTCPVDDATYERMTGSELAKQKSSCVSRKLADMFVVDMEKTIRSVEENIEVLKSWLRFPRKVIKFKAELADYARQAGCYLRVWGDMFGGWQTTIREQLIGYAEFYYTLVEIIKNIRKLFDIFTGFEQNCDLCTNERTHIFGWFSLLGLVLPDIPIIKFPKWPDIIIDLSDFKTGINIEMPWVHFVGEPILLPKLPYLHLPSIPDLSMFLQLPELPILPAVPELPDLPPLPPVPTVNLPTLPPPPKIPDIAATFGIVIPLIEKILKIWCMVKKALGPIPESMLNDEISLLTERPAYLIPLDLLKLAIPDFAPFDLGFNEIRVNVRVELGLRLKATWQALDDAAKRWNESMTDAASYVGEHIQKYLDHYAQELQGRFDEIQKKLDEKFAAFEQWVNEDVQSGLDTITGKKYLDDIQRDFDKAEKSLREMSENATQVMKEQTTDKAAQGMQEGLGEANKKVREAGEKLNKALEKINPTDEIQKARLKLEKAEKEAQEKLKEKTGGKLQMEEGNQNQFQKPPSDKEGWSPANEILTLLRKTNKAIESANKNPVDYQVLKQELGIPDFHFAPKPTLTDKLRAMDKKLLSYASDLERKNQEIATDDLRILAKDNPPRWEPYKLAAAESNAMTPGGATPSSRLRSPEATFGGPLPLRKGEIPRPQDASRIQNIPVLPSSGQSACVGSCLLDPVTNQMVTFVSYADDFGSVQTIFVPTGVPGKSDVVYNDGPGIYLKRNLTLSADRSRNMPSSFFEPKEYNLDDLMPQGESVDLISMDIQGNEASQINWKPPLNPKVYGEVLQIEEAIDGFDADEQGNGHPDLLIVLLPEKEDGSPPASVNNQPIAFGTLVVREATADNAFPVKQSQVVTGARAIAFPSLNKAISMQPGRAVYIDQYQGGSYELKAKNGFYHVRTSWFGKDGQLSTANRNEVLAPQIYGETTSPIAIAPSEGFLIPIYKRRTIRASDIFVDLTGAYQYSWDANQDNVPDKVGPEFTIDPQPVPKEFTITVSASLDPADPQFETFSRQVKVTIYVPKIALEETPLKERGEIKGTMTPKEPVHDLRSIPFGVFRQRWGIWENLGRNYTRPPQDQTRSYWTMNERGEYRITEFNTADKRVAIRDGNGKEIAYVLPATGQIELADSSHYYIKPLPADETHPTRIGIFVKAGNGLVSNVYYMPDGNTDVTIRNEALSQQNLPYIGVAVGDHDTSDDIIARNIPGFAPTYSGGVAIFNKTPQQKNIALISSWGAVRFMQQGYQLTMKNPGALNEHPIFVISDKSGRPLFDVYIAANFTQPLIRQDETWDEINAQIGFEGISDFEGAIGQSRLQNPESRDLQMIPSALAAETSPFPDVPADHPQLKAIRDLYERRIIKGYGDGNFRPDAKITRAEFVKIALGATNCFDCSTPTEPQRLKYSPAVPFPDVLLPAWYYFCVWIAKDLKMVTGYGDGYFRPERNISRAEAAAILLRQSKIQLVRTPDQQFFDVPSYAWYKDYIYTAVQIGLIKNNSGFIFPDQEITRAEFAFMADQLLNIQDCKGVDSDKDGMTDAWEMKNNLDPLFIGDASRDNDRDGLNNLQEFQKGADPDNPDTDGDGIPDGSDFDPLDKNVWLRPGVGAPVRPGIPGKEQPPVIPPVTRPEGQATAQEVQPMAVVDGGPNDLCPEIPEDLDSIDDQDGCPELIDHVPLLDPGVYVNHGPLCAMLDYKADLWPGDKIFTAITDLETHETVFSKSSEITY